MRLFEVVEFETGFPLWVQEFMPGMYAQLRDQKMRIFSVCGQ